MKAFAISLYKMIFLFLSILIGGSAVAQKIKPVTYYKICGYENNASIPVAELKKAVRLDTTAKSANYKIHAIELGVSTAGSVKIVKLKSLNFTKEVYTLLSELKPGDKLFI